MKYTGVTFFQYHFILIALDETQIPHLKSGTNEAAVLVRKKSGYLWSL
jgi:hypothetical protein